MPTFPNDYLERVYAGVLGKIIGVYAGRPIEGSRYSDIVARFGFMDRYVHDQVPGHQLIAADDDISGTFTFLRAVVDHDYPEMVTAEQIGQTWLNYLIENRTVLWWGGMGHSTEHTAYLRLKAGIPAPMSGSIELNSKVVAEQIGAQIFIDGWGMINPGDPERAAAYARRAGSVSHDGEAIHACQVVAAMDAAAFVESDIDKIIDAGVAQISKDCLIARMIGDIREWHAGESDWRITREQIERKYGYECYGGGCHAVPNHALIIHALLHGGGDFTQSIGIVNTCGWDTDCNSGNVGCVLGIRGGVAGLGGGYDWRGPVADRMVLPTADAAGCITDAATEAVKVANIALRLAGQDPTPSPSRIGKGEPISPKDGARFHFTLPGSVQGFALPAADLRRGARLGQSNGMLVIDYANLSPGEPIFASTPTFLDPEQLAAGGYQLMASPTIQSGQKIRARVVAAEGNAERIACGLAIHRAGSGQEPVMMRAEDPSTALRADPPRSATGGITSQTRSVFPGAVTIAPGADAILEWTVPDTGGQPITRIGIEISSAATTTGAVFLDYLGWDGIPTARYVKPAEGGALWGKAWVNGADAFEAPAWFAPFALGQNVGTGLAIQGARAWRDYVVGARLAIHMADQAGIAARVQGMRRYYAFVLAHGGKARLIKARDGAPVTLAEVDLPWSFDTEYELELAVSGSRLSGSVDGKPVLDAVDDKLPLAEGAIALICTEGRLNVQSVSIRPS